MIKRDEVEQIIQQQMPGWTLADDAPITDAPSVRASPDAVTPDIETLRRKYLTGREGEFASNAASATDAGTAQDETVMYVVRLKKTYGPMSWGARPKSVVINISTKKIISAQG